MNIIYKYKISFFLITFMVFGCVPAEVETEDTQESVQKEEISGNDNGEKLEIEEDDFLRKYLMLAEYLEETLGTIELDEEGITIREKYFELLSVPENVYELDYEYELVKRIDIDTEDGLGDWYHENASEDYPGLNFITKNGDLCFNASGMYNASKYLVNEDKWIRYDTRVCPDFIFIKSMFYEGEYRRLLEEDDILYIEYEGERIVIGDYNDFPVCYRRAWLIQPINKKISIWRKYFNIIKVNRREKFSDFSIFYYNLEENQVLNEFILPGLDKYKTFDTSTVDLQRRIYLRLHKEPSGGNREGHIMIVDVENDILYNIHHPYYTEINEDDDGAITVYVVGEDDNIYFQLITEQAYYIYKITPLWDSAIETEYNPRFIEFFPELQEVWDEL